jgi:putative lipoic acid-binding regulatory protein
MNKQNPKDIQLLEFPCSFPIKAMGHNSNDFEACVVEIIRRHAPDVAEGAFSSRESSNGKYLSITINIVARSQQQLDAIYEELSGHHLVVMAL